MLSISLICFNYLQGFRKVNRMTQSVGRANRQGIAHELKIGRITIAGIAPTTVLVSVSKLLTQAEKPDYSLITKSVRALLDDSALMIEPLDAEEVFTLVLNFECPDLVRWAKNQPVTVSWYCASVSDQLIGSKAHQYRGTYYRDPRHLIYSSDKGPEVYPLTSTQAPTPELLAAVCIAREGGLSAEVIRAVLES